MQNSKPETNFKLDILLNSIVNYIVKSSAHENKDNKDELNENNDNEDKLFPLLDYIYSVYYLNRKLFQNGGE